MKLDKKWLMDEIKSFFTTLLAMFAVEAAPYLLQIYNLEWSGALVLALLGALFRSAIKTLLSMIFPNLFPPRVSSIQTTIPISK